MFIFLNNLFIILKLFKQVSFDVIESVFLSSLLQLTCIIVIKNLPEKIKLTSFFWMICITSLFHLLTHFQRKNSKSYNRCSSYTSRSLARICSSYESVMFGWDFFLLADQFACLYFKTILGLAQQTESRGLNKWKTRLCESEPVSDNPYPSPSQEAFN